MKILTLCDRYPYPLTNGQNLRIFHYVQKLRERHDFDLICYGDGSTPEEIRPLFGSIESFTRPRWGRRSGVGRILDAVAVEKFIPASPEVAGHIAEIVSSRGYDLVWVSGWDMIVSLPPQLGAPLLADVVDDGVLEYWRELRSARSPLELLRTAKWAWMNYRFERRYFGPAQGALFVSEIDASFFAKVSPDTPTHVVHNGVDADYFQPNPTVQRDPFNLVFEGNIAFAPNADGILWFCREVFPLIRKEVPQARLSIVGKNPPPEIQALASDCVEVTGFVDDVRPYVDRAALFVCPLRKGAGIKNKVLQAWSMGKAVVATTPSTGGLAVDEGSNIIVRDDAGGLAEAAVSLLRDGNRRERIGAAARSTILERYTWSAKARELEDVMRIVASKQPRWQQGARRSA
jgi:glycosyltransferase involved in cell wall biosynthesis